MTKLKKFALHLNKMQDATYHLLKGALGISCTMLLCALALTVFGEQRGVAGLFAAKTAQELIATGAMILFLATIGSVVVEEIAIQKNK